MNSKYVDVTPSWLSRSMFAIGGFLIICGALIGLFDKDVATIVACSGGILFVSSGFIGLIWHL